jgi:hypothetical protein
MDRTDAGMCPVTGCRGVEPLGFVTVVFIEGNKYYYCICICASEVRLILV